MKTEQTFTPAVVLPLVAACRDWLYFIENSSVQFSKTCDGNPDEMDMCEECKLVGCIRWKILLTKQAIKDFKASRAMSNPTKPVEGKLVVAW